MTPPVPDPAFRWTIEPWGPALRCGPLESIAQHLFTSKQLQLRDADAAWTKAAHSLGSSPDRVMRVKQVHGNVVRVLNRAAPAAHLALDRPDGDAIVSNEPGLVLAVVVADCVPILMADDKSGSAAAIHAGWRGTCARVASTAVEGMAREFGANPADLTVAIGPSIGPDDYEVGESLVGAFLDAGHAAADVDRWFRRGPDRPRLDLWTANRDQLVGAGVRPDRIFISGLSTLAHLDVLNSYRAEGERAGRMGGMIVVPARRRTG